MKHRRNSEVPVDIMQWSEESRERRRYVIAPLVYKDRLFACRACQCESVFTAEEQKHEYEVRKSFVLRQRVLCPSCFKVRHQLQLEQEALAERWLTERAALQQDARHLQRWLELLERLPAYGVRRNWARIGMLKRLLESAA